MPFKMKLKPFKSETLTPESSPLKVPDQSDDADLTIDQSDVNLTMDDLGIYTGAGDPGGPGGAGPPLESRIYVVNFLKIVKI